MSHLCSIIEVKCNLEVKGCVLIELEAYSWQIWRAFSLPSPNLISIFLAVQFGTTLSEFTALRELPLKSGTLKRNSPFKLFFLKVEEVGRNHIVNTVKDFFSIDSNNGTKNP